MREFNCFGASKHFFSFVLIFIYLHKKKNTQLFNNRIWVFHVHLISFFDSILRVCSERVLFCVSCFTSFRLQNRSSFFGFYFIVNGFCLSEKRETKFCVCMCVYVFFLLILLLVSKLIETEYTVV